MSWIRQAVRACSLRLHECCDTFARLPTDTQLAWLHTIGEHWLADQQAYYPRQHATNHRSSQKYHYGGLILAGLGWLLALALVVGDLWPEVEHRVLSGDYGHTISDRLPSQDEPRRGD